MLNKYNKCRSNHFIVLFAKRKKTAKTMNEIIKSGDYVLIQRQDYMKLHRIKERSTITLGPYKVEVDAIIGQRYFDHFQMQLKSNKLYTLEKVENVQDYSAISIKESGTDNRNIQDDGQSQTLSKEQIEKLREDNANSTEILEKLITNSKTFDLKTEFSQEKYLKKKQKKYYGYITVRKPSIRLLVNTFYKQDPMKMLGMRIDDVSQLLTYGNIQSGGKYVLYDSGTSGILPAAIMNLIGKENDGRLVYMHPGNECQRSALQAMHFPDELYNRCINVNSYSVLRWFYQNRSLKEEYVLSEEKQKVFDEKQRQIVEEIGSKRKNCQDEEVNTGEIEAKKPKRPNWHYQNEAACEIFREGIDALIIVSKEHPISIAAEFLQFLKPSRSFVAFNSLKEPLQDLYFSLVNRCDLTNVKLSGNFMRNYQVLPERTHPLVNMNFGGFLLTAVKLKQ